MIDCVIWISAREGVGSPVRRMENFARAYNLIVRPGCDPEIAAFGLTTWRLDRDQIVLTGRSGSWRFAESDPTTWEKMPLSTDPLLLVKQ